MFVLIVLIPIIWVAILFGFYKILTMNHINSELKQIIKIVFSILWIFVGIPYHLWFMINNWSIPAPNLGALLQ